MKLDFDKRIDELFLDLPEPPAERELWARAVQSGKTVFLSGAFPYKEGKLAYKGRLGLEYTADTGRLAAHAACMQALGALREHLGGSFNKVKQIVMLRGYIACGAEFKDHAKVMDGASRLLLDIFGNSAGRHARIDVGVNALPNGATLELELMVEIR